MGSVDVVYPVGSGSRWDNNELRFSLRALERNFLDLNRVFVAGVLPPWCVNVIHLDIADVHKNNKDANLIDKVLAACKAGISDVFVRSSDDEILVRPCHVADLRKYHGGPLGTKGQKFWEGGWKMRLKRTFELLIANGMTTMHYDTHIPTVTDRALFEDVMSRYDFRRAPGYTINTLYCNHEFLKDRPSVNGQKLTLESPINSIDELRAKIAGKQYLGFNDNGLTPALMQLLLEMFPEPSRFENDAFVLKPGPLVYNAAVAGKQRTVDPVVIAVLGSHRSGSSCIAGMLHTLGISMGSSFQQPDKANPKGYFEGLALKKICTHNSGGQLVNRLRSWAYGRSSRGRRVIGAKYFKLCNMVDEMVRAWPNVRVIIPDRPIDSVVNSMMATGYGPGKTIEEKRAYVEKITATRDNALAAHKTPVLRLPFDSVVANPREAINKMLEFAGVTASDDKIESAIGFLSRDLVHF